jgi:hypothetical protein
MSADPALYELFFARKSNIVNRKFRRTGQIPSPVPQYGCVIKGAHIKTPSGVRDQESANPLPKPNLHSNKPSVLPLLVLPPLLNNAVFTQSATRKRFTGIAHLIAAQSPTNLEHK